MQGWNLEYGKENGKAGKQSCGSTQVTGRGRNAQKQTQDTEGRKLLPTKLLNH